jgi:hypothetical protein
MVDGAIYSGQMKQVTAHNKVILVKHGKGKQVWPDGVEYEGDWRNGMAEGEGVFNHANGDVYTGELYRDRAYGYGVYEHTNGQKYEGHWKDDL